MNATLINAGLHKNVSGLFTWGDTQLLTEFDAQPEMWKQTLTLAEALGYEKTDEYKRITLLVTDYITILGQEAHNALKWLQENCADDCVYFHFVEQWNETGETFEGERLRVASWALSVSHKPTHYTDVRIDVVKEDGSIGSVVIPVTYAQFAVLMEGDETECPYTVVGSDQLQADDTLTIYVSRKGYTYYGNVREEKSAIMPNGTVHQGFHHNLRFGFTGVR